MLAKKHENLTDLNTGKKSWLGLHAASRCIHFAHDLTSKSNKHPGRRLDSYKPAPSLTPDDEKPSDHHKSWQAT